MSKQSRLGAVLMSSMLYLVTDGLAFAQGDCTPVDVEPETNTVVIADMILPEQTLCYQLVTEAGRQVSLQVIEDDNISALLQDPMDPQKFPRVPSDRQTYEIVVKQIKRTVTPQLFRVSVALVP
ncbi:hypothetical protein SAMN02745148_02022 [Modicisalibacter ilicicola DSM 19980]|uniref:Uncharacterized protein n=1 Tax=Modicisalibacter ilicicola DSM 19980 TaxID=1121942 RepID=A0A1M4ZR46_9GAMM|nr:hypothetical protein [Halomonas ilicicola]SHF20405.1 hypothetical protein SAMN02745148_02022 [Halomonas ilicicola DSM 19980]